MVLLNEYLKVAGKSKMDKMHQPPEARVRRYERIIQNRREYKEKNVQPRRFWMLEDTAKARSRVHRSGASEVIGLVALHDACMCPTAGDKHLRTLAPKSAVRLWPTMSSNAAALHQASRTDANQQQKGREKKDEGDVGSGQGRHGDGGFSDSQRPVGFQTVYGSFVRLKIR